MYGECARVCCAAAASVDGVSVRCTAAVAAAAVSRMSTGPLAAAARIDDVPGIRLRCCATIAAAGCATTRTLARSVQAVGAPRRTMSSRRFGGRISATRRRRRSAGRVSAHVCRVAAACALHGLAHYAGHISRFKSLFADRGGAIDMGAVNSIKLGDE